MSAGQAARIPAGALSHVPALDGLRGLAVLGVLLFHGGVGWAGGGFLGVDAFFVLSGFLITGLLLAEWSSRTDHGLRGAIDLVAFWGRRARRLLPALLLLVLVLLATALLYPPLRAQGLEAHVWSTLGYVANWHLVVAGGDYFAQTGPPSPLQHTWSLAIEEQFYLLWPLIVVAVLRLRGRSGLRTVTVVGAVLSAALMALLSTSAGNGYDRAYYGTDTRAQSLLIGAALATMIPLASRTVVPQVRRARLTGVIALLVTAWLWATANGSESALYFGGFGVAALAVAAIIWSALADPTGPVARILELPALRRTGVISYGLYLWHWPLFLALTAERTGQHGAALLALRLAATFTVATLSYVLLEERIRRRVKGRPPGRALMMATAVATVATVAAGSTLPTAPQPVVVRPLETLTVAKAPDPVATSTAAAPRPAHTGPTRLLVLGDSVAATLFNGMPRYPQVAVTTKAVLGCGLLQQSPYRYLGQRKKVPRQCAGWPGSWARDVRRSDPDVVGVLVGRWEVMDRFVDGRWQALGDPGFDRQVLNNLERALPLLTAKGARLALITPPYYHRAERPDGGLWPEDQLARVDRFTVLLRQFAARHPDRVSVVDLGKLMDPSGRHRYSAYLSGVFARYDGVHVTPAAAALLAPKLLPQLIALDSR